MLSDRDIELAHPDAFDFVWGNLPAAKRAEFNRHLSSCPYCQAVVDEYREIGQIIKLLPPHAEPAADLEDRTVAAMVAALAEQPSATDRRADAADQAATRVYPIPQAQSSSEPETKIHPRPQLPPPAEDEPRVYPIPPPQPPADTSAQPTVTRLPVWRRHPRRLAAVVAAAAAVIIAAVVALSLGGRTSTQLAVAIPLHATTAAKAFGIGGASGQATARQADQSWTFTLNVHGLKPLPGNDFYECWWVTPGHTRLLATGGSFVVGNSGSTTVTMTTGVDPTQQFTTMEITAESPSKGGGLNGPVLLIS
jgi:hypothetical protein